MKWDQWYDHYHFVILNPESKAVEAYVQNGFVVSMETTSVYVLIAAKIDAVQQTLCIPRFRWAGNTGLSGRGCSCCSNGKATDRTSWAR
jgi:hypothetical protein